MVRASLLPIAVGTLVLSPAGVAATSVTTDTANRSISADMHVLPMHIGGRVQATSLAPPLPKGATAYTHEWPGIYFEAAFRGDSVVLKFDDGYNEYRLHIDDATPLSLFAPGRTEVVVSGLGAKAHQIRLEKVTESINVRGTFDGFYVPRDETPLHVKAHTRQIEFIGPSSMTGYGARSGKVQCTAEEWHHTTDTQQAYTALVAKHYGADYQINAVSGRGLIRNISGAETAPGLVAIHPFTFPNRTVPYADSAWKPQIVEIAGLADLAAGDRTGDHWTDVDALLADWANAFGTLMIELHKRSPHAAILIDWVTEQQINPPEFRPKIAAARKAIEAAGHAAGVKTVLFLDNDAIEGKLDKLACDHHLSLRDNRLVADWLVAYIDAHELWAGR